MAVYTNDLRLKEIATGDEAGTWGNSTNTNLQLIADAFGFGTEAITTNADTHTTTIADGSADAGRAIFLKYTGTLDSTCTITIGPNTVSKLWFIENATSGSQSIIISQGSGASITILNGQTKAIYSDGAGSGAAMVDAFTDLSVPSFFVSGALDVGGALTGTNATFTTADNLAQVALVSTDADASDGPILEMFRNSSSPADDDDLGIIKFFGENDASEKTEYGIIEVKAVDVSDGTEDGSINLTAMLNGTLRSRLFSNSTETVFNEGSQDLDFRVESNGNANMFVVDGTNDGVIVGSSGKGPAVVGINSSFQVIGTSQNSSSFTLIATTNDADGANIVAGKGRSTNGGQGTIAAANDRVLNLRAAIDDGGDFAHEVGNIEFAVDGTPGSNDTPGRIVFSTTADGSSSPTERARIDNTGALRINNTRTTSTNLHVVGGTASGTVYDTAVFAGGQNSTSGSGARLYLSGCENDPISRGTLIQGEATDNSNAHALVFKVSAASSSPSEALRIAHNGRLLHGTSTVPTGVLLGNQLVSSSATGSEIIAFRADTSVAVNDVTGAFLLGNSDTDGTEDHFVGMYAKVSSTNGSQNVHFVAGRAGYEGDSPDLTLFSGGDLSLGTTSPAAESKLHVECATSNPNSGSPTDSSAIMANGGTTTEGTGPVLALRNISGSKETIARFCAETTSNNNGDLTISVYGGGATVDERVRFLGDGRIFMGTTTNLRTNETLQVKGIEGIVGLATANGGGSVVGAETSTNTAGATFAGIDKDGAIVFKVAVGGNVTNTNNSYGAISDQKVKENIADASSQWDDIKAVRVRNYSMIADKESSANRIGVVAQELESAGMGGLVETKPDFDPDTLKDLGTTTKSVKYSVLYMKAIKALQEAMEKIETLETKVAALEGGS